MTTSRLALVCLTSVFLCVGNAGGQDKKKAGGDAALLFEKTLAKAKDGDVNEMVLLGLRYAHGEGVIEDDKEVVKWYSKAADLGNAEAMFVLGSVYTSGDEEVAQDDEEAAKWWKQSAELGYVNAMVQLAVMYATGKGVTQDIVEAYAWLNVADAMCDEKKLAMFREKLANHMTPEQAAEAANRSIEIVENLPPDCCLD